MTQVFIGQILKNKLSNGETVLVEVIGLNVAGTDMARVCRIGEILPVAYLIEKNKTWACPLENLIEDGETRALTDIANQPMSHKESLIHSKF